MQRDFITASQAATKKNLTGVDAAIQAAMPTVHWLAKEDVAIKKYPSLMEFQKHQGCEPVSSLSVGGNATYLSRAAGQECVAEAIRVATRGRDRGIHAFRKKIPQIKIVPSSKPIGRKHGHG